MPQFEGGGIVQGVTKLITTFFNLFNLKQKKSSSSVDKNEVDSSYLGVVRFFKNGEKKNQLC